MGLEQGRIFFRRLLGSSIFHYSNEPYSKSNKTEEVWVTVTQKVCLMVCLMVC
jgi:hypothetical protein